jgi:hypothetical protein
MARSAQSVTPRTFCIGLLVGNRTELRAVHGTTNDFKNTYTYDKLRRMTEVTQTSQPGGNAVLPKRVALEYNALGQRTKISRFESTGTTNAVATTDFTYDFANRLSSIAHKQGTTNLNTDSWGHTTLQFTAAAGSRREIRL